MEEITSPIGETIAIIVKDNSERDGMNFISKEEFPLQVGINNYKEGEKIKPHIHVNRRITIDTFQEVVYVKKGAVRVNLYDSNRQLFKTITLSTGDIIFLLSGGHGFEITEDSTIFEVKQGPYLGKSKDKEMLE